MSRRRPRGQSFDVNLHAAGQRPPILLRPHFPGVADSDWTDLPPAQYPADTVEFIRIALAAPDRKTLNGFLCDGCQGITMTIDRHPGYSPLYVDHKAFDPASRCPGMGTSLEYPDDLPPADWTPSHEWIRPSEFVLMTLEDKFVDHVMRGGLILRVIPLEQQKPAGR